jgi:hypothetical protein
MKKIVAFELGDEIPDNAEPIGVVAYQVTSKNPWESDKEVVRFYYAIPVKGSDYGKTKRG